MRVNNLTRKSIILLAGFFLPALLSVEAARSQDVAGPDYLPVDVMWVLELPAQISNPMLYRSEQGYVLRIKISNNSDDRILGFTYQLIVLDSTNKLRKIASRTCALKLPGYSSKDLTLRQPRKLKFKNGDHVVLAVDQVITRDAIWAFLNSREAIDAYRRGDYLVPEVKKVLNQVDSKPGPIVIY